MLLAINVALRWSNYRRAQINVATTTSMLMPNKYHRCVDPWFMDVKFEIGKLELQDERHLIQIPILQLCIVQSILKSDNLQYNTLGCWVARTNVWCSKFFPHNFLQNYLQKSFQFIFLYCIPQGTMIWNSISKLHAH